MKNLGGLSDEDMHLILLESFIHLMEKARVNKDELMFNSYARLVYETFTAITDMEKNKSC